MYSGASGTGWTVSADALVTYGDINTHMSNQNIHVTTAQVTTWNGKQNALSTTGTSYGNLSLTNDTLSISDGAFKIATNYNNTAVSRNLSDNNVLVDFSVIGGYSPTDVPSSITSASTASDIKTAWDTNKFSLVRGNCSVVWGNGVVNLNDNSAVFGVDNFNSAANSLVAGQNNYNTSPYSMIIGYGNTSSGSTNHIEGQNNQALNNYNHVEGYNNISSGGNGAHVEGQGCNARGGSQHVQGKYNTEDWNGDYANIIGNGTADNARSNAQTVTWTGIEWLATDVTCGGTNANPAHALSNKVDEAPTGGTMYVRQSAGWTALPTAPPAVHLIDTITNTNELPVFAPLFFRVDGNHSTVIYELIPTIENGTTMTGCVVKIRPFIDGDTVMFRNGETWTHDNTFIVGGQTLADLGYTANPTVTSSGQSITSVTLTFGQSVEVSLYTELSIQYKTWAGIFNGVTWNDEYKVQVTTYKLADGLGGCYYCTSDNKYYVFDGYTWTPYDVVTNYNLFFNKII